MQKLTSRQKLLFGVWAMVLATIGWIGMVVKGQLPLKKTFLIFNPFVIALLGNLLNCIAEGLDSGTESLGWLLMYLVCATRLVGKDERQPL